MAKKQKETTGEKKKAPETEKSPKEKRESGKAKTENEVLIGRKPVMNYVVACMTFFNAGEKRVAVKARGRAISKAVDAVELLRRAFLKDVEIQNIDLGTQQLSRSEGQTRNVSNVEIILSKTGT